MASSSSTFKTMGKLRYHTLRASEALVRGDLKQAPLHIELAFKFSDDLGYPYGFFYCLLAKAHMMHQLERDQEAAEYLARALNIADRIRCRILRFDGLLVEALFAFDQGGEESATTLLRKALAIGEEGGYFYAFIGQPYGMARLCIKALEAGIEIEYVRELIRKLKIIPERPPIHLEDWPWPLKIFTLHTTRKSLTD